MNENEIKNGLKESVSKYEIKTSSSDILNEYYARKEEKKPSFFSSLFFKISAPVVGVVACAALAVTFIPSLHDLVFNGNSIVGYKEANSRKNQTAFSIFSGMTLLESTTGNIDHNTPLLRYRRNILNKLNNNSTSSFEDIVYTFDPSLDVVNSLLENSTNIACNLEQGNFVGLFGTYPYKLNVKEYTLYTNICLDEDDEEDEDEQEIEKTYQGEIIIDETHSHKVVIEMDSEIEESNEIDLEIEMEIDTYDGRRLEIKQEMENDERTYKYVVYDDDMVTYSQEISFENRQKKNDFCDISITKNNIRYDFEDISKKGNEFKVNYKTSSDDKERKFTVEISNTCHEYTGPNNEKINISK